MLVTLSVSHLPHSQLILLQASSNPNIYISLSLYVSLSLALLANILHFCIWVFAWFLYYWSGRGWNISNWSAVCPSVFIGVFVQTGHDNGYWATPWATMDHHLPANTFLTCNDEIISPPPPPPARENTSKQQTNTRVPSPSHLSLSHCMTLDQQDCSQQREILTSRYHSGGVIMAL